MKHPSIDQNLLALQKNIPRKTRFVLFGVIISFVVISSIGLGLFVNHKSRISQESADATRLSKINASSPKPQQDTSAKPLSAQVENSKDRTPTPETNKSSTQSSSNSDEAVNVGGVMSKPGCYAGCMATNPGYTLVANPSAITVTLGTTAGPFTASISDGHSVAWNTPYYPGGLGPFGFTRSTTPANSATMEYYIDALNTNIVPGSYVLTLDATDTSIQKRVHSTVTVTVAAPQ